MENQSALERMLNSECGMGLNSKLQIPNNLQIPISNMPNSGTFVFNLGFWSWELLGDLVFGIW
jgi:hypothetical protein